MKQRIVLIAVTVLLILMLPAAGIAQEKQSGNVRVVGSVSYGNNQEAVVSTTGGGNAMIQFRQFMLDLDKTENAQMVDVLQQAIELVDVAVDNGTSISLAMGAGQVMSSNDVKVRVKFETSGTGGEESTSIPIQLSDTQYQEDLVFQKAQAQEMIGYLNTCHETASDISGQLQLFVDAKESDEEE